MTPLLGAFFLVAVFAFLIVRLKLVAKTADVARIAKDAVAVIRDDTLDDDAKEVRVQNYSKKLFGLFFILLAGGAVALGAPLAALWGLDVAGVVSLDAVIDVTLSWRFIVATTVVGFAAFYLHQQRKR